MSTTTQPENQSANPTLIAGGVLVALVATGIWATLSFVAHEKEREVLLWQDRLGVVADSRVDAVDRWLDSQISVVNNLADNTSLQLYLTQLSTMTEGEEQSPEHVFLRSLLIATADRHGYSENNETHDLQANVSSHGSAGMALLDNQGNIIVGTRDLPHFDATMRQQISTIIAAGGHGIRDLYLNAKQQPSMVFFAPILPIQGDEPLGVVMAVKPVGEPLFSLLRQKGLTTKTHETLLVRKDNDNVIYLSPQADGTPPLKRRLAFAPQQLISAAALENPGRFVALKDYSTTQSLAVSRTFSQLPWVLVQKINRDEALAKADEQGNFLLIALLLLVGTLTTILVAAWRHGSSVRYRKVAEELEQTSQQMLAQKRMLNAITDNVTDFLAIVDSNDQFIFANGALAKAVGAHPDDFIGKTTGAMFGVHVAETLAIDLHDNNDHYTELVQELEIGGQTRNYSNLMVPLPHTGPLSGTQLLIMRDVTDLLLAEERQERVMWQLVETLTSVLDEHDPYSANHSSRVATVARAIAEELGLDKGIQTTVRIAGSLINLGKLSIPKEILTKSDALTDEEFALINEHLTRAGNILSPIDFEGPVVDAIVQSNEFLDGSGKPSGLIGDDIILPARILNIANSFVAMTNPRPWREALSFQQAIDRLNSDADHKYDRKVIATLYNLVENRGGNEWTKLWKSD